jgi:glycosyltransferase involved in cell wall biosynthesis
MSTTTETKGTFTAFAPVPLSAFILTKNEQNNLKACLQSLAGWCDDIHILDSLSTDGTLDIAREYTTQIHQHAFEGHTKQRTWALRNLPFKHDWVIALDADHRVTSELRDELRTVFKTPPTNVDGFYVKRRQIFRGRWIKFGGYYPKYMLKVFRHANAYLDDNEFDYRFYVDGHTHNLKHDILEANQNEWQITFFVDKHNRFATELATEEIARRHGLHYLVTPSLLGTPDQRILWLKQLWRGLPLYIRPLLLFCYRYFLMVGFLDGTQGFIFHFLQSFWFRLLVDIRIAELQSGADQQ